MAQRNRFNAQRKNRSAPPPPRKTTPEMMVKKPTLVYGKPFVLLEDSKKNTFGYEGGAWVPYAMTIAQCRLDACQVTQLAQKVNNMTRYEVRSPLQS
jgi:hypothetical protein